LLGSSCCIDCLSILLSRNYLFLGSPLVKFLISFNLDQSYRLGCLSTFFLICQFFESVPLDHFIVSQRAIAQAWTTNRSERKGFVAEVAFVTLRTTTG
jgi:hypothetical protein